MTDGKVKWDLDVIRSSVGTLGAEKDNLWSRLSQMRTERGRVDTNWKSPAGKQYQSRLSNDIDTLDNIVKQLENRLGSLRRVQACYSECESAIAGAMRRLP